MGSTDVQVYINTSGVRNNTGQYYHDRNITIKPATRNLSDSTIVRFYFLDSETEALINATGCGICTKPTMAYELGVSKYTDPDYNYEDGTLMNDQQGVWSFITSSNVTKVTFDKGYYAEFKVKDFSEFWLNNGGISGTQSLPLELISFTAKKKENKNVLVEWVTAWEQDVDRYEIEVAKGNDDYLQNNFIKIGIVNSSGNSTDQQRYSFIDAENNKTGVRFYRLKMIDFDGSYSYSAVRPVLFNDEFTWQLYPNPSNGIFNFVFQANNNERLIIKIYDINGRLVKRHEETTNGFLQKFVIDLSEKIYPAGLYLINVETEQKKEVFRIIKQ
jgi:hypothetical protein